MNETVRLSAFPTTLTDIFIHFLSLLIDYTFWHFHHYLSNSFGNTYTHTHTRRPPSTPLHSVFSKPTFPIHMIFICCVFFRSFLVLLSFFVFCVWNWAFHQDLKTSTWLCCAMHMLHAHGHKFTLTGYKTNKFFVKKKETVSQWDNLNITLHKIHFSNVLCTQDFRLRWDNIIKFYHVLFFLTRKFNWNNNDDTNWNFWWQHFKEVWFSVWLLQHL